MSSLFYGVNLALRAVLSHQQAIEVIQHNVANANTPGYRRQQAVLVAGLPYAPPGLHSRVHPGQMGGSVMVDSIRRYSLEMMDGRYRRETGEASRYGVERDVLQQLEATLAETTADGLVPKLDEFWTGWRALAADPTNTALRGDLRVRSQNLVDAIHRRAVALQNMRVEQNTAIVQRVDEVNDLATRVAHLNGEVARVLAVGEQPNDLLDERDRLLDRLSEIAGAQAYTQPNGEVIVSITGHALVMGQSTLPLATSRSGSLVQPAWADGQPFDPQRGELKGLLYARDTFIVGQQAGLDTLAQTLAAQVNGLHQAGYGLPPAADPPPVAFFTGTDAMSLRLSADITDPVNGLANIATAGSAGMAGDGSVALGIADLLQSTVMSGSTATMNQFYTGQVGSLGLQLRGAITAAKDRQLVADSLDTQRESVGGVSLDEEAANLVQSQRAYQAAVRMMTTVDEMIDRMINGMGLVGR